MIPVSLKSRSDWLLDATLKSLEPTGPAEIVSFPVARRRTSTQSVGPAHVLHFDPLDRLIIQDSLRGPNRGE
jgi:PIN domain nuclease of toxin-antitoxin system